MSSVWSGIEPIASAPVEIRVAAPPHPAMFPKARVLYGAAPQCTVFAATATACFLVLVVIAPRITRCPRSGRVSVPRALFWGGFFAATACLAPSVCNAVVLSRV